MIVEMQASFPPIASQQASTPLTARKSSHRAEYGCRHKMYLHSSTECFKRQDTPRAFARPRFTVITVAIDDYAAIVQQRHGLGKVKGGIMSWLVMITWSPAGSTRISDFTRDRSLLGKTASGSSNNSTRGFCASAMASSTRRFRT